MNPNCIRPPHFPPHCGCPAGFTLSCTPVLEPRPVPKDEDQER